MKHTSPTAIGVQQSKNTRMARRTRIGLFTDVFLTRLFDCMLILTDFEQARFLVKTLMSL